MDQDAIQQDIEDDLSEDLRVPVESLEVSITKEKGQKKFDKSAEQYN